MAKPHKWANVIKAWADGKPIQVKYKLNDERWYDWAEDDTPCFGTTDAEWRIKPSIYRYRMVLEQSVNTKTYWVTATDDPTIESSDFFVKWLTDWVEIELPQDTKMSFS